MQPSYTSQPMHTSHPVGPAGTVSFDVTHPEHLSRGLIFIKWLLAIPQYLILYFLTMVYGIVGFIAWWAILFTGRYPRGLWEFSLLYQRWATNVSVYVMFMRDEYPPFAAQPYPLQLDIVYPERLSRGLIFIKWLLVIPHIFVLMFLGIAVGFVWFISFWAILFTGRYPRGMFDFVVGVTRWSIRVNLYSGLMTDVYPPFSLD